MMLAQETGMMLAQERSAQGEFEPYRVADLQAAMHMLRRSTSRNTANVEFEAVVALTAGHGIAAGGNAIEADLRILSGGKVQRRSVLGGDPNLFDVVGEIIEAGHHAVQASWRLSGLVDAAQPSHGRMSQGKRPTGQDQAVGLLLVGEREA